MFTVPLLLRPDPDMVHMEDCVVAVEDLEIVHHNMQYN